MKTKIDKDCPNCGEGWHGPVPEQYLAYIEEQWKREHQPCMKSMKTKDHIPDAGKMVGKEMTK